MRLQVPDQLFCTRHRLRRRKTLAHQRFANHQKLFGADRQIQRLHHVARQITCTTADDVLFHAPVERASITRGNRGRDLGIDPLGVQQQAVHVENHGLDRAELFAR
ncbi:hypothetical protein D3C76_1114330 [compost metagenome]